MRTRRTRTSSWSAITAATTAAWLIGVVVSITPIAADNTRWGADYFPNVTLTTQDGAPVHFYDDLIKGKTVAIDLIYTTCQYACPLETARLAQVQRVLGDRVGRDIFFYSITIDPDHDTPAVLKEYAAKYHVGPGWTFLTGRAADIELISKKLGLYSAPNPDNPDGHTPNLLVGNEPSGQWMRNSALDNPGFLARTMSDWLDGWKSSATKPLPSFADVPVVNLDVGEYTFRNHCAACHRIGGGDAIGPDLKGVTATRDHEWLKQFIATPDRVFDNGDPIAWSLFEKYGRVRMPNLSLTEGDATVLIDYLARTSGGAAPVNAPGVGPMPPMAGMPDVAPARAPSSRRDAVRSPSATDVSTLVESYLGIQQALAADRLDGVSASALALANATVKIGSSAVAVRAAVNPFAQVTDLRSAREAFGGLSDALLDYIGTALPDGLAVAYCPMARKSWLQRGAVIQNPYYGRVMGDCGRVVDRTVIKN
ncbi:MAG TPA: SCO family protein [Vicinamibacterales bacterium]|nr:SCO family protein [Vicinamibacterales bacterium]